MLPYLPQEIVEIIIEYCDYIKLHKKNMKRVFNDIIDIGNILNITNNNITPSIAYICWNTIGWSKYINQIQFDDTVFDEVA